MSDTKTIHVSIDIENTCYPVGTLWCHQGSKGESASFEYSQEWLQNPRKFEIEPALKIDTQKHHTGKEKVLFGSIGDSAPDRWGRILMKRAEQKRAKQENRAQKTLLESDYLLGVNDESRQGALRFSTDLDGEYLATKTENAIPPLTSLAKLKQASDKILTDEETAEDIRILLDPGSSLGGARPKSSVRDQNNQLAIAKFTKPDDEYNVILWEAIALELAQKAGINTAAWSLEKSRNDPILILKRFDGENNKRIPFLSAMAMLQAQDLEDGHSYLEIADAIKQYGNPQTDLLELWKRMVFTVLITNTDNHLRNHAFLYDNQKWRLSPSYDVNPTPIDKGARILAIPISDQDFEPTIESALSVADYFNLKSEDAKKIAHSIANVTSTWRNAAKKYGLSLRAIDKMATAFEHGELEIAKRI